MKRWFGPRQIGWGVAPHGWQGWLLTLALIVLALGVWRIPGVSSNAAFAIVAAAVVGYLGIASLTYRRNP